MLGSRTKIISASNEEIIKISQPGAQLCMFYMILKTDS